MMEKTLVKRSPDLVCSREPLIHLNFAVFLYNAGERKPAAKQFSLFEQKFQKIKQSNPNDVDQEVRYRAFLQTG